MGLILQRICIGFDLCIESAQILAGRISIFNIVLRASWFVIVVKRLARYELVGSGSISRRSGCTCSKRICTKSLAPGVFISCLGFSQFLLGSLFIN